MLQFPGSHPSLGTTEGGGCAHLQNHRAPKSTLVLAPGTAFPIAGSDTARNQRAHVHTPSHTHTRAHTDFLASVAITHPGNATKGAKYLLSASCCDVHFILR